MTPRWIMEKTVWQAMDKRYRSVRNGRKHILVTTGGAHSVLPLGTVPIEKLEELYQFYSPSIQTIEGYPVIGPRTVVQHRADEGDTIFVQKTTMRGAGWLRFVKKISAPGYHVSWYRTKGEAIKGMFGT